jgi:hypothetical protein
MELLHATHVLISCFSFFLALALGIVIVSVPTQCVPDVSLLIRLEPVSKTKPMTYSQLPPVVYSTGTTNTCLGFCTCYDLPHSHPPYIGRLPCATKIFIQSFFLLRSFSSFLSSFLTFFKNYRHHALDVFLGFQWQESVHPQGDPIVPTVA